MVILERVTSADSSCLERDYSSPPLIRTHLLPKIVLIREVSFGERELNRGSVLQ